jgi:adenylate cyclase
MIAGDAGSITATDPQHAASDYTVLGDNVNLSARLESANKALGSRTLCVEHTIELMGDGILYRPMARLQVKGKSMGVMTYEPLCLAQDADDKIRRLIAGSKAVVDAYIAARFDECVQAARAMQDEFGSSMFTTLYIDHAREFAIAPPGEEFDGTIVLESK